MTLELEQWLPGEPLPPLRDLPSVRRGDPGTSKAAYKQRNIGRIWFLLRILAVKTGNYEFTDDDAAWWARDDRNIVARRRKTLERNGLVSEAIHTVTKEPITIKGRRGRMVKCWRLTELGLRIGREIDDDPDIIKEQWSDEQPKPTRQPRHQPRTGVEGDGPPPEGLFDADA